MAQEGLVAAGDKSQTWGLSKGNRAGALKYLIGHCAKRIGMVWHKFVEIARREGV